MGKPPILRSTLSNVKLFVIFALRVQEPPADEEYELPEQLVVGSPSVSKQIGTYLMVISFTDVLPC